MKKPKVWLAILVNIAISILYFKQIIFPGKENAFLKTTEVLLTPFLLLFTLLGVIVCLLADKKIVKDNSISTIAAVCIIFCFLIFPLSFYCQKNGSEIGIPFFTAFIEPAKTLVFFNQSIKKLLQKTFMLLIASYSLIFLISFFFIPYSANYIYCYGGLYFGTLALWDFYNHN